MRLDGCKNYDFSVVHMHSSFLDVFSSLVVIQIRTSQKLKEIIQRILYLGNILNQGTARGKFKCLLIFNIFLLKTFSLFNVSFDSRVEPLFHCIIYLICLNANPLWFI